MEKINVTIAKNLKEYQIVKNDTPKFMEQNNPNLKVSANKPTKFNKVPKFLSYHGSRKDNKACKSSRYSSYSFQKFKCSDLNMEKSDSDLGQGFDISDHNFEVDNNSKQLELNRKLEELLKYKNELIECTNNTKVLEEKYMKINSELNEMKQKHTCLINKRNLPCGDFDTFSDSSSTATEYSLQRKCAQIFQVGNSSIHILSNKPLKGKNIKLQNDNRQNISIPGYGSENKENLRPSHDYSFPNEYSTFKTGIDEQSKSQQNAEVFSLKNTITKLQNESERYCSIIEKQNHTLSDYRLRFVKTQELVEAQQMEIDKLNSNSQQLETEASHAFNQMRHKIEGKLKYVDLLSNEIRAEQVKREHTVKENCTLRERIKITQAEANELKIKLDEMNRRKITTISRLKIAEKDLKIFKNYNAALKQEKQKLNEQMQGMNEQIQNMQNINKRTLNRHREHSEKQRRELQKRIFDLEMKLNNSQNSTTSLIQERDTLIAELQSQLNNLVHNFEVSQKHIRVLRRHIYSICGNNNRFLKETA